MNTWSVKGVVVDRSLALVKIFFFFFFFLRFPRLIIDQLTNVHIHTPVCVRTLLVWQSSTDITYVCTYAYEKKKGKEREREKAKITHINDGDRVDGKQGCGLFSSYLLVSVLHASSTSVNIYMLKKEGEGRKSTSKLVIQWRQGHW